MAVTERDGILIIDDSYNANPDSMRAGLDALETLGKGRRKIAVLGAMLELGEASEAEHAAIGEYACKSGVDVVVAVGQEMDALVAGAKAGGIEVVETGADTAIDALSPIMADGDVILFKGSNGSGVWRVADALMGKES